MKQVKGSSVVTLFWRFARDKLKEDFIDINLQDTKSILYFDEEGQKTICPVKDGHAGVVIAKFIPK